jgi:tetratricopeptide (TPR) repeat protein
MRDETSMSSVLPSTNAADAYAADLTRLCTTGPVSPNDDAWLILAHAFGRFEAMSDDVLVQSARQVADVVAIDALSGAQASQLKLLRVARALRGLGDAGDSSLASEAACDELVIATRAVIEEMEIAGAFALAYASLHGLLGAFGPRISTHARGGALVHQGRAVRQMGFTDLAHSCYQSALDVGTACQSLDLIARAHIGLGVLAITRGNYPAAREHFQLSLENADRAKDPELIRSAHHGLMNCCMTSGDLEAALVHGWNVLRLCISADSRAEALMNLGEICRMSGEHHAALRVYAVAMEWTSHRRVRLHAASGALSAAVAAHRVDDARRYVSEIDALMPNVPDVYTRASVGVDVADALHRLGDTVDADAMLQNVISIAATHSFHEITHRAEQVSSDWHAAQLRVQDVPTELRRRRVHRSEPFRMVLRSLNGLTAAAL